MGLIYTRMLGEKRDLHSTTKDRSPALQLIIAAGLTKTKELSLQVGAHLEG